MDPRHNKRIKIIQNLYAFSYHDQKKALPFPEDTMTSLIIKNFSKINQLIKKQALKFPLDKIAKIDLAILQLAVYELFTTKKEPEKVIINEAVELAKELGGEKSFSFINGVLGNLLLYEK